MSADWQVITQLLSSSKCPSVMWGSGSRAWVWHHVARSERGYSCTRLPHMSWRLKCWSRQPSKLPLHVGANVSDCLLCRICFPWLPLAILGCCLHSHPAMLDPSSVSCHGYTKCWSLLVASDHQGLLPFVSVSNSTCTEDVGLQPPELFDTWAGTWDCCAPAGRAPCGGTASPEIPTTKIFTHLQLWIRTRCSCWNPGTLQQQMTIFGNETKPQREGEKKLYSYWKSVRKQLLSRGLSPLLPLCKTCFPVAGPAPNDLYPEPHLACWCCRPKNCTWLCAGLPGTFHVRQTPRPL